MSKVIFRLKGDLFPESWELPLRNMYHPRPMPNGQKVDKLVHYLKGASSIWAEDYKGDKKPIKAVYFENGVLEVPSSDLLLLEILSIHRFNGVKYEKYDAGVSAEKKLEEFELREKALSQINVSGDRKIKAMALAIIGSETMAYSTVECLAALKSKAYENPKEVIDKMNESGYEVKFLSSMAFIQGVVKTNEGQTAVVWGDTSGVILKLAVGENPIEQLAKFLGVKSESSIVTLQKIGSLVEIEEQAKEEINKDAASLLSEKDKEIEELKRKLAEKTNENTSESDKDLLDLRTLYFTAYGKEVPANKKNDSDWITQKIQEAENTQT